MAILEATIVVTTPTTTQPQHEHENDFAYTHHPPTETQHWPLGAPDEHLWTPTWCNVISNNKQGQNNNINKTNNVNNNNNNSNNNNINDNNSNSSLRGGSVELLLTLAKPNKKS